jgi:hypothetical protein
MPSERKLGRTLSWKQTETQACDVFSPSSTPSYDSLTLKHRCFVDEYVIHGSAARAAREAGYSPRSSHVQGCRLYRRQDIRGAIAEKRAAQAMEDGELAQRATAVLAEILLMPEPPDGWSAALLNVKRAAAVDLLKLKGQFVERHEHGRPGEFDRLSDDELRHMAMEQARTLGLLSES